MFGQSVHWDGHTDLTVAFAVTDADTHVPIPHARIEVRQTEGGFYEDTTAREFTLTADAAGVAVKECRRMACSGHESSVGWNLTYLVAHPDWHYRVVAAGYAPGEWVEMQPFRDRLELQRTGPRTSAVTVPVSVRKR